MKDINECWNQVLKSLENEISTIPFETWFKVLKPVEITENEFVLQTPTTQHAEGLKRYMPLLKSSIKIVTRKDYKIRIQLENDDGIDIEITKKKPSNEYIDVKNNLIPRYVFENFVMGSSNQIAYAASLAVAESPGTAYNPLFLYGGVGLGKTHLMHSIAHYMLDQNPNARVLYASSEKFTNEFITAIREKKQDEFKEKYRNIDALLIDDVQFLAKKESTQEEFFHTFNQLWELNKQIILSSDKPPSELKILEERLRSRFSWGLIADIQQPDFETRTAILEKKAEIDGIELPKEVYQFIAKTIVSNIRELEGALTRVAAYTKLANMNITPELVDEALKDFMYSSKNKKITIDIIQSVTADYFNIKTDDILSSKRSKNIVYPRQIAMYLCRKMLDTPLVKVGESFGGRDHTTVMHSCEKIAEDIKNKPEMQKIVTEIETIL